MMLAGVSFPLAYYIVNKSLLYLVSADSTLTTREAGHLALRAVLRAGLPPAPVEHRISGLRGSSGDTGLAMVALGGSLA